MNKKILYSIFFISFFLLSTASMVRPVQGYEHGIPPEAVGVTVQSEVKIYDEDEWEKHFGKDGDEPDDVFESGMDEAGAKNKQTILEIEEDEELIAFLDDHLFESDTSEAVGDFFIDPAGVGGYGWTPTVGESVTAMDNLMGAWANVTYARNWLIQQGTSPAAGHISPLLPLNYLIVSSSRPGIQDFRFFPGAVIWPSVLPAASTAALDIQTRAIPGIFNESEVVARYGEKYDGTYLHRDLWDYISPDEEFDPEPDDEDDEAPFLADPQDWYDQAEVIMKTTYDFNFKMTAIDNAWDTWFGNMDATLKENPGVIFNATLHPYAAYNASLFTYGAGALAVPRNITDASGGVITPPGDYMNDAVFGLYLTLKQLLGGVMFLHKAIIPTPSGLLWNYLTDGLPTYQPSDDFWAKVLDLFDVDDEEVEYYLYYVPAPCTMDVSREGSTITVEIEYEPEDPVDETDPLDIDPDDTLEDFTVIFGDDVIFEADGEIFFQFGGVEQIPGYEITVILGASAVSILALVYVIMKKRKR